MCGEYLNLLLALEKEVHEAWIDSSAASSSGNSSGGDGSGGKVQRQLSRSTALADALAHAEVAGA